MYYYVLKILIAAHGNSLRGVVKHLDGLTDAQIMKLNLPTGKCTYSLLYTSHLRKLCIVIINYLHYSSTLSIIIQYYY